MLCEIHDSMATYIKTDTLIENFTLQTTFCTAAKQAGRVSGARWAGQRVTLLAWPDHHPTTPTERKKPWPNSQKHACQSAFAVNFLSFSAHLLHSSAIALKWRQKDLHVKTKMKTKHRQLLLWRRLQLRAKQRLTMERQSVQEVANHRWSQHCPTGGPECVWPESFLLMIYDRVLASLLKQTGGGQRRENKHHEAAPSRCVADVTSPFSTLSHGCYQWKDLVSLAVLIECYFVCLFLGLQ